MWCCVGTGLENHGKYGEFIYTYGEDTLYVNLFVASELNRKDKGVKVTQNTHFPYKESAKLTFNLEQPSRFSVMIRSPWWVKPGTMKVVSDGKDYAVDSVPSSYIAVEREWKDGDVVEISFPMPVTIEELPNVPNYISILRGPIVLGTRLGTRDLRGLVADDHRWTHIAHGTLVSLFDTPPLVGTREEIQSKLENMQPVPDKPLHFAVPNLFQDERYKDLVLEPFFGIHDSHYMVYWYSGTQQEYDRMFERNLEGERRRLALDARTVDAVNAGEQQPEVDHSIQQQNSESGVHQDEAWRHAWSGGYFQYEMKTNGLKDLSLMVRYWGNDSGNRTFDILIDGQLLVTENITGMWNRNEFVNVEYKIPAEMLESKERIVVRFAPELGNIAGGVYEVRLLKDAP